MKPRPIAERFWEKADKSGGPDACWPWLAFRHPSGYGQFGLTRTRHIGAHRMAWRLTNGDIPPGMFVCHRCDNPPCVNPAHLFVGTSGDNARDMVSKGRDRPWNRGKSHCRRGHEFTPENTHTTTAGERDCIACRRAYTRKWYAENRNRYSRGTYTPKNNGIGRPAKKERAA